MAFVTFVGLGAMGFPMAASLLRESHSVAGFDLDPANVKRLQDLGAESIPNIGSAIIKSDFVITMLPNGKVVRTCLLESPTALEALKLSKCTVIDMSSSSPVDTRNLEAELSNYDIELIDAPVSGGVKRAEKADITIMAGGDSKTIREALPVLESIGSKVIATGKPGSGHALKAINNYVSAAGLVAACEAIKLGKAFGLDPKTMLDALNASSGKNNATENKMKQFVLSESFASGFALNLMAKDINIAAELAHHVDCSTPTLEHMCELWTRASSSMSSEADHTEIFKYLSKSDDN